MKRSYKSIIWGIALIAVGLVYLANNLELINIDFKGWWTVFIIVPAITGIFTRGERVFGLLGLATGVLLLFAARGCIDYRLVWQVMVPVAIVFIGIGLVFNSRRGKKVPKTGAESEYVAIFGGDDVRVTDEFKGTSCVAVFGGIDLDLSEAIIKEDVEIEAIAVFGGIEIILPKNVSVQANGTSIFGGCDNSIKSDETKKQPTVYINYVNVFAGSSIKQRKEKNSK